MSSSIHRIQKVHYGCFQVIARSSHDFLAGVIIDVDRLILETLERLLQIMRGERISRRNGETASAPWSGEIVVEHYGDEYFLKPALSPGF